ncbi:NAD-dependent protein deacylase [Oleiphilus sp. HI0071]|uniref:Sir2 family NAD+-dependent deacetylase n=1 Tax=Oleiphilus sp. HI0080 TaxID=1822255 RepID=UPI0007C39FBB|nr:Sir2 family NAD+-dependent deacetylase [Oleiphilus sp. HI0080]KZY62250.1 NAD-dependent protein deacylase [Oleiphilus sp. HI0065]KZY81671.1 NAD-dependent protein deacylase [Oleiphilus sp. HI0071]KZZ00874.1 NAD-dependent protein deacylase [Oleiphilus sp. HI0073]KZZ48196.1 NAD-dependent protein deacylase [Oleiphilus sp. HI0122]KZZ48398.1 NAD-dependent protein deacylase [Oleiphilus sp. HI0118]KZZ79324.1 NAD-dependent protein deacylase [Oleiphilus sp. HI0133]
MRYRSVVVLTGAGISAESGIQTFRASDGLWENHRVEDVASPEGFERDPELVLDFYNQRRAGLLSPDIQPNPAHKALVHLEREMRLNGQSFLLVTQNIDDLHERAGSVNLRHMHGELLKVRCQVCASLEATEVATTQKSVCSNCGAVGELRPHVVWFGEMPLYMDEIYQALEQCDLFLSIGTSGNVYPAAGFVEIANRAGAETIEINLEPSAVHTSFDRHVEGKAGEALPSFVEMLLNSE